MIELIVEDYCQECPEFTPDTSQQIAHSFDGNKAAQKKEYERIDRFVRGEAV